MTYTQDLFDSQTYLLLYVAAFRAFRCLTFLRPQNPIGAPGAAPDTRPASIADREATRDPTPRSTRPLSGDPADGKWMMASSVFFTKMGEKFMGIFLLLLLLLLLLSISLLLLLLLLKLVLVLVPFAQTKTATMIRGRSHGRTTGKIRLIWADTWGFLWGCSMGKPTKQLKINVCELSWFITGLTGWVYGISNSLDGCN